MFFYLCGSSRRAFLQLQGETKSELTPASPAKVSKQTPHELRDLPSPSCHCGFACPAPFLHGNGPFKNPLSAALYIRISVLQSMAPRYKPTPWGPDAEHRVSGRALPPPSKASQFLGVPNLAGPLLCLRGCLRYECPRQPPGF